MDEELIKSKRRYYLIDAIRGFWIVNMVLYHFLYDVFVVYGKKPYWYGITSVYYWQQSICWSFILISGFVWTYGIKGNLKRGLMFNLFGFIITAVTLIVTPSEAIWFGILNFMGCAVLLMFPIDRLIKNIPPVPGMLVSFLLFLLLKKVQYGIIGLFGFFVVKVPDVLYEIKLLTPLGFPYAEFWSSDFFPILPWLFLFITGYFANKVFSKCDKAKDLATLKIPGLSFVGSKTIWIYLIHQPINMLICMLLFE